MIAKINFKIQFNIHFCSVRMRLLYYKYLKYCNRKICSTYKWIYRYYILVKIKNNNSACFIKNIVLPHSLCSHFPTSSSLCMYKINKKSSRTCFNFKDKSYLNLFENTIRTFENHSFINYKI